MTLQNWWWLAAAVLGIAEIFTGSFYLLVLGVGAAGAALAALMGFSWPLQLIVAAVISGLGWYWVHRRKRHQPQVAEQSLDVGEMVQVSNWQGQVGQASYRGAIWQVELAGESEHRPSGSINLASPPAGQFRIRAIRGNRLLVSPV